MDEQQQLISELKDDLRRDALKQLWEKHGGTLIGVCVAAVIGTGLGVAWRDYQAGRNATYTGQLVHALRQKDDGAKQQELEAVIKTADGRPQAVMARFHLASMELESDKSKDALEQYRAVVADKKQDDGLRDLARVLAADAGANNKEAQPASEPVKPGAAFYDYWREADAWRVYAAGNAPDAQARFGALKDDVEAPSSLRARMQAASSLLSPETSVSGKENPPEEKAD